MADRRVHSAPGIDVRSLADAISNWFKARDFETQIMMAPGGGYMIQARQPSAWRSVLGRSSALLVTLVPKGEGLEVTTAAAKWADKVGNWSSRVGYSPLTHHGGLRSLEAEPTA